MMSIYRLTFRHFASAYPLMTNALLALLAISLCASSTMPAQAGAAVPKSQEAIDKLVASKAKDSSESVIFIFLMPWRLAILRLRITNPNDAAIALHIIDEEAPYLSDSVWKLTEPAFRSLLQERFTASELDELASHFSRADVMRRQEAYNRIGSANSIDEVKDVLNVIVEEEPPVPVSHSRYEDTFMNAYKNTFSDDAFCVAVDRFDSKVRERLREDVFLAIMPSKSCLQRMKGFAK